MLTLSPRVRIFLAAGPTDLRKSFDTLASVVRLKLDDDPLTGHLFVFCNRNRNRLKILLWEESGFWLLCKRLEKGSFRWPAGDEKIEYNATELSALLGGLDLLGVTKRRWYKRRISP